MSRLGDNIKLKRKQADMTLEELALKVGTRRQTLSRYETGKITNIPSDKIEKIAKALNTTPAFLMDWEDTGETYSAEMNDYYLSVLQAVIQTLSYQVNISQDEYGFSIAEFKDNEGAHIFTLGFEEYLTRANRMAGLFEYLGLSYFKDDMKLEISKSLFGMVFRDLLQAYFHIDSEDEELRKIFNLILELPCEKRNKLIAFLELL